MKKIFSLFFLLCCCITNLIGQTNLTPFTGCPSVYIIGYKNGTNCTADGVKVYTTDLAGNLSTLLFTTSTTQEVNGIGISSVDSKGYAMLYDRIDSNNGNCSTGPVQLLRFGANGVRETLGPIPVPSGITISTALGAVDASGTYFFLATIPNTTDPLLTRYYLGRIPDVASIAAGGGTIPANYTLLNNNCPGTVFADWAFSPADGQLYSYGVSGITAGSAVGTLMKINTVSNEITCVGTQTAGVFTSALLDNFGGVMFGSDGFLYGVNVYTRKFYKISPITGDILEVSTIAGGSGQLRGDMGSCASFNAPPPPPTPFTSCPNTYVIGFKNGYNCTADSFKVYTSDMTGNLSATPLFTLPDTTEINGIGISSVDQKGYAIQFDRQDVAGSTACTSNNIRLVRFGANGSRELLGLIPPPSGTSIITALGTVDASDTYLFGAANSTFTQFYLGKIANISTLTPGSTITPTYSLITVNCPGRVFADWAVNPSTGDLYTYAIYPDGTGAAGTLMYLNLTTNQLYCTGTPNTIEFTNASQDNFAGIYFGTDGMMYGMNVNTRKFYRINPVSGALTQVNTIPGGLPTTPHLRGDMGSCVTTVAPTSFNCPEAYVVGFKNGYNCTADPFKVYTSDMTGNLSAAPLFTTPDSVELNGIGINRVDGKGYAIQFDRVSVGSACIYNNITLVRFGANGSKINIGIIPPPPGGLVNTALGTVDAADNYLFGANVGSTLYIGKIANISTLTPGSTITPTYTPVGYNGTCPNIAATIFADWAINPMNGNLYTYGIYPNGGTAAGILISIDKTTNMLGCLGTPNTTEFLDPNQDNFAGIYFGTDGMMYGMNVNTRKFYRINPVSGALTQVNTIPGGLPTTPNLRGDMGSCVSYMPPTPFTSCPNTYIIGYKNGYTCDAAPTNIYTMDLAGNLSASPIITTSASTEINSIGIAAPDGFAYAMQYERFPVSSLSPPCLAINVRLVRIGVNGSMETIGLIPPPASGSGTTSIVNTALGAIDAAGNYYFGGISVDGNGATTYYVGKIASVQMLTPGSPITPVYTPITRTCDQPIFSDWAINPSNNNQLFTYGIYNNGGTVTGTLMVLDLTTHILTCIGTPNTTEFTDANQDNFGGIMYGTDGYLYGMNVNTRKFYRIDPASGNLTYVSSIPGGSPFTPNLRGDLASCVSSFTPLTSFSCPNSYVIGFKNGYNCTADSFKVYSASMNGTLTTPPLFTMPDNMEINGIGISKADGKGYAIQFDRITTASGCNYENIRLVRFGANGSKVLLGLIPAPPGGAVNTALGTVDTADNYLFGANVGSTFYIGKIAGISTLTPGSAILPTYTPVEYNGTCPNIANTVFADWAINPFNNNLYTYGIYPNGGTAAGIVMYIDMTTNRIGCSGTPNTTEFLDANQDNFAGIYFGTDGMMYGMNVNTRKFYQINQMTGAITQVNTISGGLPTTPNLRGDMGSCVSDVTVLPIGFSNVNAVANGVCKVAVSWEASGAQSGDKFYMEKSSDSRSFTTLAMLTALPNTLHYTVEDTKPGTVNYYRIKGASKDGTTRYSNIVRFLSACGGKNSITLYENLLSSNVLNGEILLQKTQNVSYNIINASGAKVYTKQAVTSAGTSRFSLHMPALAKGLYLLQVTIGSDVTTLKFVVQ